MICAHNLYNILQQILSGGSESATGEITLISPTGEELKKKVLRPQYFYNKSQVISYY